MPARNGGAKALLLTVLGEFVLPAGGHAWTSSLIAAAEALGIAEKNARQALTRIGDQGFIEGERHGRAVRWTLTSQGRQLLETGTQKIYGFGRSEVQWDGQWLLAHCPVPESQRAVRKELRAELGHLGFGELSASLLVSPHLGHQAQLRQILDRLDLLDDSTLLVSTSVSEFEDRQIVAKAWDLQTLGHAYAEFANNHCSVGATKAGANNAQASFAALVELVHGWRRFPFLDPNLPTQLLPADWPGASAVQVFHEQHAAIASRAQEWFASQDRTA